jgi:hypothetical protein
MLKVASNAGASSSLLDPSSHQNHFPLIKSESSIQVEVRMLDDLIEEAGVTDKQCILLFDLQGYELEALRGSKSTLSRTNLVVAEVQYQSLFNQAPSPDQIRNFLHNAGFRNFWKKTHLTYGDECFLNSRLTMQPSLANFEMISAAFHVVRRLLLKTIVNPIRQSSLYAFLKGTFEYFFKPKLKLGFSGPMNGQSFRMRTIKQLFSQHSFDAIFETGTFRGTTSEWFSQFDLPVFTSELNQTNASYCRWRFMRLENVSLFRMDSRIFLQHMAKLEGTKFVRPFIYLDAHWNEDLPLWEELKTISSYWPNSIVVVDDFSVPGDLGYRYDDYGVGKSLDIATLQSQNLPKTYTFFPTLASELETGFKRGWVCICFTEASANILKSLSSLKEYIQTTRL